MGDFSYSYIGKRKTSHFFYYFCSMNSLYNMLLVALGGAAGSILRWYLPRVLLSNSCRTLPLGTALINILGCLLIGFLCGLFTRHHDLNGALKPFLIVGFCGGFTTFSTFCNESLALLRQQQFLAMACYVSGSVFLGLLAVYGGMQAAKWI